MDGKRWEVVLTVVVNSDEGAHWKGTPARFWRSTATARYATLFSRSRRSRGCGRCDLYLPEMAQGGGWIFVGRR
jgi:hypothetical protein